IARVSWFDRSAVSSSRPSSKTTSRADAVKDGRRSAAASHSAVARPRLDGGEHGVNLQTVGTFPNAARFNGCYAERLRRVAAFLAAGFEQEPGAALGFVDEGLEQSGGAGIAVLVAELVRLSHRRRHVLVVSHQLALH